MCPVLATRILQTTVLIGWSWLRKEMIALRNILVCPSKLNWISVEGPETNVRKYLCINIAVAPRLKWILDVEYRPIRLKFFISLNQSAFTIVVIRLLGYWYRPYSCNEYIKQLIRCIPRLAFWVCVSWIWKTPWRWQARAWTCSRIILVVNCILLCALVGFCINY